ncbi:MAG: ADP-ribosylation factor-like protein [Chloroflexota bacterium]|nr:gliding-motility protein MglA [Chloroflexia bacterium]MDQ3227373.1 ADP-ribosylation factor-like protein [Chloroflexota bacterium]
MALIDLDAHEIHAKIVYFGPELSGKTTTLRAIAEGVPAETRGSFRSIASESARTIFSDSLAVDLGERLGFRLHWHLYTVPGQPRSAGARAAVLQGVDGIVFIADATPLRMAENMDSLAELKTMLTAQGKTLMSFPIVLACNKSDLPGAAPAEEVAISLDFGGATTVETSAIHGEGVFDGLRAISRHVAARL